MRAADTAAGVALTALAEQLAGTLEGNGAATFRAHGLATLADAGPGDLSFLLDARHRPAALASRAGALLVGSGLDDRGGLGRPLLVVRDPGMALSALLGRFAPAAAAPPAGVDAWARVDPTAEVDATASVGPFAVVGAASRLGPGVVLHPHAVVGRRCSLGAGVVVHPHAVLYDDTELGERVVVHAGAVVGSDGFGYQSRGLVHHKVPQIGRTVLEADVEVGANAAIDRAMLAETRIGAGTKIDNLVQVGHNVRVGRGCLLCGQAGIAGSATLEDGVVLAGQAGVAGHLTVGRGVQVAAKSAVLQGLEAGARVAGVPAIELGAWRRQAMLIRRLPEMLRRLRRLETQRGAGTLDDEQRE